MKIFANDGFGNKVEIDAHSVEFHVAAGYIEVTPSTASVDVRVVAKTRKTNLFRPDQLLVLPKATNVIEVIIAESLE